MNSYLPSPFEIKEIKEDAENFIVEGMASVYGNVDLGDDIVEAGAFRDDLTEKGNERPILWQHFSSEPIGLGVFSEMGNGLFVKIMLPKADQFVRERVMPQIKIGSVKGLSIGYKANDYSMDMVNGKRVRRLKRCGLRETSCVTFPMNEEARIMAAKQYLLDHNVKSLEEDSKAVPPYKNYDLMPDSTKWDNNKAIKQIRSKTGSQSEAKTSYKDGFMYYDADNPEKLTSYKLPYVYVDDGKLKAVPRALSAIVGALRGARGGGVDIPSTDKEKVKAQVNKYFKKMGREEPFKGENTFIDNQTLTCMDVKNISIIFEKDVILSSQAKETLIRSFAHDRDHGSVSEEKDGLTKALKELNRELDNTLKGAKNV
jgi:HK97 family phage prohead protease